MKPFTHETAVLTAPTTSIMMNLICCWGVCLLQKLEPCYSHKHNRRRKPLYLPAALLSQPSLNSTAIHSHSLNPGSISHQLYAYSILLSGFQIYCVDDWVTDSICEVSMWVLWRWKSKCLGICIVFICFLWKLVGNHPR